MSPGVNQSGFKDKPFFCTDCAASNKSFQPGNKDSLIVWYILEELMPWIIQVVSIVSSWVHVGDLLLLLLSFTSVDYGLFFDIVWVPVIQDGLRSMPLSSMFDLMVAIWSPPLTALPADLFHRPNRREQIAYMEMLLCLLWTNSWEHPSPWLLQLRLGSGVLHNNLVCSLGPLQVFFPVLLRLLSLPCPKQLQCLLVDTSAFLLFLCRFLYPLWKPYFPKAAPEFLLKHELVE